MVSDKDVNKNDMINSVRTLVGEALINIERFWDSDSGYTKRNLQKQEVIKYLTDAEDILKRLIER